MCTLLDFRDLELLPQHRAWLVDELASWHESYLPVSGTVIDIGAGCGETALFYLMHGATQVVAIEGAYDAFTLLRRNFAGDNRVIPIYASVGKVKVDIEGGEEGMDVEAHFPYQWRVTEQRGSGVEQMRLERLP